MSHSEPTVAVTPGAAVACPYLLHDLRVQHPFPVYRRAPGQQVSTCQPLSGSLGCESPSGRESAHWSRGSVCVPECTTHKSANRLDGLYMLLLLCCPSSPGCGGPRGMGGRVSGTEIQSRAREGLCEDVGESGSSVLSQTCPRKCHLTFLDETVPMDTP